MNLSICTVVTIFDRFLGLKHNSEVDFPVIRRQWLSKVTNSYFKSVNPDLNFEAFVWMMIQVHTKEFLNNDFELMNSQVIKVRYKLSNFRMTDFLYRKS